MSKIFYEFNEQLNRQRKVYDLLIHYTAAYFNDSGEWVKGTWCGSDGGPGLRERLWYAMAYFASGNEKMRDIANAIIVSSKWSFCHFAPMASLQIIIKYDELLDEKAKKAINAYLESVLDEFSGEHFDFIGVNDNFPSMATYTALFGGKLFNRPELYSIGVKRLEQLKSLLTRRGVLTEYTSPTYTPISTYAMAEIANYINDEKIRDLALACEEHLWADILGHYHPETYQMAGPYSRAYTVDSVGHTHQARFILYSVLGDKLEINPLNTLFLGEYGQDKECIHGDAAFMQVSTAWMMSAMYHCPAYMAQTMLDKNYPYEFYATTEFNSSTDSHAAQDERDASKEDDTYEYAAGSGSVSTYMTEDYALGVTSHEFHNGIQTDSFHLLYRRRAPAKSQADIATVYARYIINEKKPGQSNFYPLYNKQIDDSSLWDEGRKIGVHHANTAMILYKPKVFGSKEVSSLKLSLIFPAHYGPVEEIWLGDEKLHGAEGQSAGVCPVFIKDGPVYMAFHPLIFTDHGRKAAIKAEKINDFVVVSFYNYEGSAKDFAKRGFLLTGNGFIIEVRNEKEAGSFNRFKDMMKDFNIKDTLFSCNHSRWTGLRRTRYERAGLIIECEYSPVSEGIKHISINGNIPESPRLKIKGMDVSKLPFYETTF